MVFNFFHARKTREVLRESKGKIYFVTKIYIIINDNKNKKFNKSNKRCYK